MTNGYLPSKKTARYRSPSPPDCPTSSSSSPSDSFTAVCVRKLTFQYPYKRQDGVYGLSPCCGVFDINLDLHQGSILLVVGANGSGKSTLLSILAGRKMIPKATVHIFGLPAFHDTSLEKDVAYFGEWWKGDYCMDVLVGDVLKRYPDSKRFEFLRKLFQVELGWSIVRLSEGEKRRVQLLAGLCVSKKLYIFDEATAELDLLTRKALMMFLKWESTKRGVTVIFATHLFDFMDDWPTHILYLRDGQLQIFLPVFEIPDFRNRLSSEGNNWTEAIQSTVLMWLMNEVATNQNFLDYSDFGIFNRMLGNQCKRATECD